MTEPRCATHSDHREPEQIVACSAPATLPKPNPDARSKPQSSPPCGPLHGRRILLVEDEAFAAFMIETMLLARGCCEVWIEASVDGALERLRTLRPDVAVLDVNLGQKLVFPVAEQLERMGVPLLFATAYPRDWMPPRWQHAPLLQKPYELPVLLDALLTLPSG